MPKYIDTCHTCTGKMVEVNRRRIEGGLVVRLRCETCGARQTVTIMEDKRG